jgi:hypothetical protein
MTYPCFFSFRNGDHLQTKLSLLPRSGGRSPFTRQRTLVHSQGTENIQFDYVHPTVNSFCIHENPNKIWGYPIPSCRRESGFRHKAIIKARLFIGFLIHQRGTFCPIFKTDCLRQDKLSTVKDYPTQTKLILDFSFPSKSKLLQSIIFIPF